MSIKWIDSSNFGKHCDHTFRIRCPGTYKLKENISFNPKDNKTSAIVIDANSVILDLNGKILKQSQGNTLTQVTGITVKTGHTNVTILGSFGVVRDFTQRGIYVEGGSTLLSLGDVNSTISVTGCGYGTPIALRDGSEYIMQCGIQLGDMVFFVKFGIGTYNGILNQVRMTNVISTRNNTGGILGEMSEVSFIGCNYSDNMGIRLVDNDIATKGGFYIPNSVICYGLVYFSNPDFDTPTLKSFGVQDALFENCKFNSNVSEASLPISGKYPDGSYTDSFFVGANTRNLKLINCQFNSNNAKISPTGLINNTRGCVLSSGEGTVIENCEFSGNIGGSVVNGLNLTGLIAGASPVSRSNYQSRSTTIRKCVASRNVATTASINPNNHIEVIGFSIRYPSGCTIVDCTIEDNVSTLSASNKTLAAFADGIFIFSDINFPCQFANNIEVSRCKLSRNRVTYGTVGTSSGIRVFDDLCENIVIRDNVITENWRSIEDDHQDNTDYAVQGAGVDLFNQTADKTGPSYVSVLNNVIKSNNDFGVYTNLDYTNIQSNNIQNHNVGVDIADRSCGNSILGNTILLSFLAGVSDFNVPSSSYVANNVVFGPASSPYFVEYNGGVSVPVDSGSLAANPAILPPLPSVSGSNTSVEGIECDGYEALCVLPPTSSVRGVNNKLISKDAAKQKIQKLHEQKHATIQFRN